MKLSSEELTRLSLEGVSDDEDTPAGRRRIAARSIETRAEAVDEFERRTGLFAGDRPAEEDWPGTLPWPNCRTPEFAKVCRENLATGLLALLPCIRFRGRDDRDRLRVAIRKVREDLWTFVRGVSPRRSLPAAPPPDLDAPALSRSLTCDAITPGTPEEEAFWREVEASGEPAVMDSANAWKLAPGEVEALATLFRIAEPYQDPPVPTPDQKVTYRRGLVFFLGWQVRRPRDGKLLSGLDVALFLWGAAVADFWQEDDFYEFARTIRRDWRYLRDGLKSGTKPLRELLPFVPETQQFH